MGQRGGLARALSLTPEQRSTQARVARAKRTENYNMRKQQEQTIQKSNNVPDQK